MSVLPWRERIDLGRDDAQTVRVLSRVERASAAAAVGGFGYGGGAARVARISAEEPGLDRTHAGLTRHPHHALPDPGPMKIRRIRRSGD
jgi:hypothetical protein